jgi:hypothetical protein
MISINGMILSLLEYALMLPKTLLRSAATKRPWTTKFPTKNAGVLGKPTNGMKNSGFSIRISE